MKGDYRARLADRELRELVTGTGAVVIEGPRACGKTETARRLAASEVLLDIDQGALAAAQLNPSLILEGKTPRLIDEWQLEPSIWNHVRRAVDDRGRPGQFILTGSSIPTDEHTRHSGAGRFARLRMRPMSLSETGASTAAVSLDGLMQGGRADSPDSGISLPEIAELISRGGWPTLVDLPLKVGLRAVSDYLDEVRRTDIRRVDGVNRDPERVGRVMASLARNVATEVSAATIAAETSPNDPPKQHTVGEYLSALERLFVVENQPAWAPHLRSRHLLRGAPKRHFVDPSLAVAALRSSPDPLLRDLNRFGLMFESLVVRDLRIYSQAIGGTVSHYRDSSGLEVDAIVEARDGLWLAIEVKLGGQRQIEEAARELTKFVSRIDTARCGDPAALVIIVASGYAYTRRDGIQVVPITTLGG